MFGSSNHEERKRSQGAQGWNQKWEQEQALATSASSENEKPSSLTHLFLNQWAWGGHECTISATLKCDRWSDDNKEWVRLASSLPICTGTCWLWWGRLASPELEEALGCSSRLGLVLLLWRRKLASSSPMSCSLPSMRTTLNTPLLEALPWHSLLGRSSMKSPDSFGTSAAPKHL